MIVDRRLTSRQQISILGLCSKIPHLFICSKLRCNYCVCFWVLYVKRWDYCTTGSFCYVIHLGCSWLFQVVAPPYDILLAHVNNVTKSGLRGTKVCQPQFLQKKFKLWWRKNQIIVFSQDNPSTCMFLSYLVRTWAMQCKSESNYVHCFLTKDLYPS